MSTKRTWTDEQFAEAVRDNTTIADTIRGLGLVVGGANYKQIHLHVERLGLDISHWKGRGHGKGNKFLKGPNKRPLKDILVKNSTYTNTTHLKERLYKEGLLEDKCAICGMEPVWNSKPLVFALDHVNGDNRDHRLGNLRLLCPNCDSQQPTFRRPKTNRFSVFCKGCGVKITSRSKTGFCEKCVKGQYEHKNQYTK